MQEDAYEYGNPLNAWKPANEAEAALSAAAYRWRRSLHQKRVEKNESVGAFAGWKVRNDQAVLLRIACYRLVCQHMERLPKTIK